MDNPPGSPSAYKIGPIGAWFGRKLGILKTITRPPEPRAQLSGVTPLTTSKPSMGRAMTEYSDVFMGDDPYLTGGLPLQPKRPAGEEPRAHQYPPGYNIQITPRSTEPITFQMLRALGDYSLVRVVIERIKLGIKAQEWVVVPRERSINDDVKRYDNDIKFVTEFFKSPDKEQDWKSWIGQLMEELLVIDALSIYRHRTRGGKMHSYEIIDGSTIKTLIDDRGFQPKYPAPAYQQFLYGNPYVNLTSEDLIYRPANRRVNHLYGFSQVEWIIVIINMGIRRELYQLAAFTDSNIPAGVGGVPKEWGAEEIKKFQDWFNAVLSGDPQQRSKIVFVPETFKLQKFNDNELFGVFNPWDEYLARIICFAFGISPTAFVKMVNRATSQEMGDVEAEYGLASVKMFIEGLMNDLLDKDFGMPYLRFNWTTDRARLQEKRVKRNVAYVGAGIFGIDEVREEEGLDPVGAPMGIITQTGFVPLPTKKNGMVNDDGTLKPQAIPPMDQDNPPPQQAPDPGRRGDSTPVGGKKPHLNNQQQANINAKKIVENDELRKWQKVVEKKGKDAAFTPMFIESGEAEEIRAELVKAKFPEDIDHIFTHRKRKIPALRLPPQSASEASHFTGDLQGRLRRVLESVAADVVAKR